MLIFQYIRSFYHKVYLGTFYDRNVTYSREVGLRYRAFSKPLMIDNHFIEYIVTTSFLSVVGFNTSLC